MPTVIAEFQQTPNPNAIKCVLALPQAGHSTATRSYRSRPDSPPATDPVASALFSIPAIESLLIADSWITVNKSPNAAWSTLKPQIEKALAPLDSLALAPHQPQHPHPHSTHVAR